MQRGEGKMREKEREKWVRKTDGHMNMNRQIDSEPVVET